MKLNALICANVTSETERSVASFVARKTAGQSVVNRDPIGLTPDERERFERAYLAYWPIDFGACSFCRRFECDDSCPTRTPTDLARRIQALQNRRSEA